MCRDHPWTCSPNIPTSGFFYPPASSVSGRWSVSQHAFVHTQTNTLQLHVHSVLKDEAGCSAGGRRLHSGERKWTFSVLAAASSRSEQRREHTTPPCCTHTFSPDEMKHSGQMLMPGMKFTSANSILFSPPLGFFLFSSEVPTKKLQKHEV